MDLALRPRGIKQVLSQKRVVTRPEVFEQRRESVEQLFGSVKQWIDTWKRCVPRLQSLMSGQQDWTAIGLEHTVSRQKTHPFGSSLRDQDAVKRIAMMARQD